MLTPLPRILDTQPHFWPKDQKIKNIAHTRNLCGEFYEILTANLTGAGRLRTDSRCDICPDLDAGFGLYFETKSVGLTGQSIVYDHRFYKANAFTQGDTRIVYWIWHHRLSVKGIEWASDLHRKLLDATQFAVLLSQRDLQTLTEGRSIKVLNKKYNKPEGESCGWSRNGYGKGWSIPIKEMVKYCGKEEIVDDHKIFYSDGALEDLAWYNFKQP